MLEVCRVVLLIMAAILLHNAVFIVEQPGSSLLEAHPRFSLLIDLLGQDFRRLQMWMQPYGGSSRKSTLLYSNFDISGLWLPLDTSIESDIDTVHRRLDSNGVVRVTGAESLKSTQAYPVQFGHRVADVFASAFRALPRVTDGIPVASLNLIATSSDSWSDAGLETVIADLALLLRAQ